jgi:hypothetical protein
VVAPDKDHKPKYTERLNGPIQSTAGDILYLTLKKLTADPRPGTHFLLSVDDELVLEYPKEDAREVALWLKAKMGEAMEEILRRSWAESLVDRSLQRSAMVRAGASMWRWRRCFNNIKNKYTELRVRTSLTENGTRRIELVRA